MLHVHRSERADRLVDALADLLLTAPPDPFTPEVVAVPAQGVERWVTQRLSHVLGAGSGRSDGVCANVVFPHPSALVAQAVAAAVDLTPEEDPWEPGRLLWRLVEVVDAALDQPECTVLARRDHGMLTRRLGDVAQVARLFASYAAERPAMLRAWAEGADTDGTGAPLDPDLVWQARLWRSLRDRLGLPSPAERLPGACDRLRSEPGLVDLPGRLSLLGPTRLTSASLTVLSALAVHREVHLWLPHPSAVLWERVASCRSTPGVRRRNDPTADLPANPLLASLGRDARELQVQLAAAGHAPPSHHPRSAWPDTLLGRLQQAVSEDAAPRPAADRPLLDPADRSVTVHSCHGPARQVEVLREVLLGLLADDPTLQPRDVLVMCPDVEDYAPLVTAAFGLADAGAGADGDVKVGIAADAAEGHPGHQLRVRLADRALRQTNPLLATVSRLLELAGSRLTASEVLDLAASAPVRRRFRFDDNDLARVQDWVAGSGARWGVDVHHRARFGLGQVAQGTWRAGLDRLLLGAVMDEEDLPQLGAALPLDDVDSGDIDLVGRFAEYLDRLAVMTSAMAGEHPLGDWLNVLRNGLDELTAVPDAEGWQAEQAHDELAGLAGDAGPLAGSVRLTLAEVRTLLADRLAGRPTRANFRTGTLTLCSLVPMRSVPHRVVCLLGLDDGRFPRQPAVDGDDVLARDPLVGERDPRSEDRQLLLDAVFAAQEHLVLLYTGADPRTNARRAPAVPVAEFLDALDGVARTADGSPVRSAVLIGHPLQPFDPRNFSPGALGSPGPVSFDPQALQAATRARAPRSHRPPVLSAPLPPAHPAVALPDLLALLEQPAAGFVRHRLGVTLVRDEPDPSDDLPIELDALTTWAVGDRLLRARLRGADPDRCVDAERRRGALPPLGLARVTLAPIAADVEALLAAAQPWRDAPARTVDVTVDVDGRQLFGTVAGVHGACLLSVDFSRLAAKQRLRAWVRLLALTAADPTAGWTAVTIGRAASAPGRRAATSVAAAGPLAGQTARQHLGELLDLHARGLRVPLPMPSRTAATYAQKRRAGQSPANAVASASQAWYGRHDFPSEQAEEAHVLMWGENASLDDLLALPPLPDERGPEWPAEPHRFGVLARRLWDPLLAVETGTSP